MQSRPHGKGHRWRRFVRENRGLFFTLFLLVLILTMVAVVFWMMSSIRFAVPH